MSLQSFYPLSADYKLLKYQQHICCPEGRIIDFDIVEIMISILALMEISNHLIGVVSHQSCN